MKLKYLKNVVTLKLNEDVCTGCGMCMSVCPQEVFEIKDGKAHIADKNSCMECGACARNCPFSALAVRSGVGCASGIITGILTGTEPRCDCSDGSGSCC